MSNQKGIPAIYIYQLSFIAILFGLGYLLATQLSFLFAPFMWAIALYVLLLHPYKKIVSRYSFGKATIAFWLIILIVICIILFLSVFIAYLSPDKDFILKSVTSLNDGLQKLCATINERFSIDILSSEVLAKIGNKVGNYSVNFIQNSANLVSDFFFTFFLLYFMLINSTRLNQLVYKVIPFNEKTRSNFIFNLVKLIQGNILTIPLVALSQAVAAIIGYLLIGVDGAILLGFLTGFASIIPIVGTAIVYVPLALYYLLIKDASLQALFIVIYGVLIIGAADNLARMFFQKKFSNIGVFDSTIGLMIGINIFGMSGIIFGPILMVVFRQLVEIYIQEFGGTKFN